MQVPVVSERQQQVWPLDTHPPQLQLGQVQVRPPDAFVASMQLQPADPLKLGFMCGSLPVPTFNPSDITTGNSPIKEAALVPATSLQSPRSAIPRYRILPNETDLNMLPSTSIQADPTFPCSSSHEAAGSCKAWAGSYLNQPLARKCEALAVNALVGYGDEIDVVAPLDILKRLFKTPYCKARLSLAVHRVGRTLILNSGPDEWRDDRAGAKLSSQKKVRAQATERTLFSNFVQHSMNEDSCDSTCSPSSDSRSQSTNFGVEGVDDELTQRSTSRRAASRNGKQRVSLGHYRCGGRGGGFEKVQKRSYVAEQQRETESVQKERLGEAQQRPASDGYLRVLFWQFQNLRMLLGSDLLLFSNDNHSAVSLRLLEIERQVTPLVWLDAWLDNVMASIPELAVCYHRNGVVQGYELLKTDDIFLLKGLADDGTAFFHPHVVKKNASTVLRFLKDNCKQDPGTYWLLKNAGEDLMQLFDLSVVSKTCSSHSEKDEEGAGTLPSTSSCCNEEYSLPLAMLLYRLTHRLSQSKDPANRLKCVKLFGKCLEFMEEQRHLIIRASGHEHVARLILTSFKEIGSFLQPLLLESRVEEGVLDIDTNEAVLKLPCSMEETVVEQVTFCSNEGLQGHQAKEIAISHAADVVVSSSNGEALPVELPLDNSELEDSCPLESRTIQEGLSVQCSLVSSSRSHHGFAHLDDEGPATSISVPHNELGFISGSNSSPSYALTDAVSSCLAAVHHVSQAIKALRWQRQLDVGDHLLRFQSTLPKQPGHGQQFPLCICGEVECVAICDFREIGVGASMDEKLWRLILLLGEAYFALGEAYKDQGLFSSALKAAELACLIFASLPEISGNNSESSNAEKDTASFWNSCSTSTKEVPDIEGRELSTGSQHLLGINSSSLPEISGRQQGQFWGRLWMLVGDVYVEIQRSLGEGNVMSREQRSQSEELAVAQDVMKEVKRLKKKIGQMRGSCGICSLTSCSCKSDRASSGDSASSCTSSINTKYERKHKKTPKNVSDKRGGGDVFVGSKNSTGENGRIVEEYSSSVRHTDDAVCNGVLEVPHKLRVDAISLEPSTSHSRKGKVPGEGCSTENDIYAYLRRPVMVDKEANLSAAVDCYAAAVTAFTGVSECSQEMELSLRKKGWSSNELGRMRLAQGQIRAAEAAFASAIGAFRDVKDPVNVVLVCCNLGHGQRAAAEAMAEKLSAWKDCDFRALFMQVTTEAKRLYGEALKFYGMARLELLSTENNSEQSMGGLWVEVLTQLAHTYLRLGMLLAKEDKFVFASQKNDAGERRLSNEDSVHKLSAIKDVTPTKDAITKALEIYKSLGSLRAQEAAFAQYQLACHHGESCRSAVMQPEGIVVKKVATSVAQKAKRHAFLAELYWQKALDFYQPETHSDMFLDILMEKAALCLVMGTYFHQNQMEKALNYLLEGRRALVPKPVPYSDKESGSCKIDRLQRPSASVIMKLMQQVQLLLKNMLSAAMQLNRPSQSSKLLSRSGKSNVLDNPGDAHGVVGKSGDVVKLKEMYRIALQEEPDLNLLFSLWAKEF